jgi:hypothetical protein
MRLLLAAVIAAVIAGCSSEKKAAPSRPVEDPMDDTVAGGEGWLSAATLYPTRDDLDSCSGPSPKSQCEVLGIVAGPDHRAAVVDQYLTSMKVRVIDGPAAGKEGWCNKPCLRKKPADPQAARPAPSGVRRPRPAPAKKR